MPKNSSPQQLDFTISLKNFHLGFAPLTHIDSLTELGDAAQASVITNADVISLPKYLTQGPGLSNLTNGTEAGVVSELITFIMDRAVTSDITYASGNTKLFKLSSTAVTSGGTPSWPKTISGATGVTTNPCAVIRVRANLYYFWNGTTAGDIGKYDLASAFDDDWGSTVPTGAATLQYAPHPAATKEDIMVFGNGRYAGTYIDATTTLAPTKLDFGTDNQVDDVIFHANQWWLAVNAGVTGTNRTTSQVYLYDGAVVSSILADEVAVGVQKIGFLYALNGIIYIAYQDLSSDGGYKIGYISGRQIKELRSFTGTLPNFAQKTLYKNTILFLANNVVWSAGAVIPTLPIQISQHADAGFSTAGAIAAPFGTPLVSSTESTSYKIAKFSGYDTNVTWKSIIFSLINGRFKGAIDYVIVRTKTLGANASCALTLEVDQNSATSSTKTITGTDKRYFKFTGFGIKWPRNDVRVALSWSGGNTTNDALIKEIIICGHFVKF